MTNNINNGTSVGKPSRWAFQEVRSNEEGNRLLQLSEGHYCCPCRGASPQKCSSKAPAQI